MTTTEPSNENKLWISQVFVQVKAGTEDAFLQATLENARQSVLEAGILRFDVLQDAEDATKFCLYEVYVNSDEAVAAHKETVHFATWRDTVADMMAEPRSYRKWTNVFPSNADAGWKYPNLQDI